MTLRPAEGHTFRSSVCSRWMYPIPTAVDTVTANNAATALRVWLMHAPWVCDAPLVPLLQRPRARKYAEGSRFTTSTASDDSDFFSSSGTSVAARRPGLIW